MNIFSDYLCSFFESLRLMLRNRELMFELSRRDISDKYVGQFLGRLWAIFHPIFLMSIYVFVFNFVFKVKMGSDHDVNRDYTVYILSGLIPWIAFQESMIKSCTAISSNSSLVKQVVFPIEILPIKGVISAFTQQIICTFILLVYSFVTAKELPNTYLLFPVLLLFQFLAMAGVSFLLSAVGTYFKDIKDFIQLFSAAGMYLMPIFYLPGWVPAIFKPILYLNPFSYLIWCYQDVFYFGEIRHSEAWIINGVLSVLVYILGYRLFRRLKLGFGSVL